MSMVGVGTDIIDVTRVARLLERNPGSFTTKWFTSAELSYCQAKSYPAKHLAGRLAAKEAVWKAIGVPWDGPVPWPSIEITRLSKVGPPQVELHGAVGQAAAEVGVISVLVSIALSRTHATATAIALARSDGSLESGLS